jgi:hypothetical protein
MVGLGAVGHLPTTRALTLPCTLSPRTRRSRSMRQREASRLRAGEALRWILTEARPLLVPSHISRLRR